MPVEALRKTVATEPQVIVGSARTERLPELAQVVWHRALALARTGTGNDPFEVALDLLRTAQHQPGVMAHALTLSRTQIDSHPDDERARTGAEILQAAIAFLGIKPRPGDIARATPTPRTWAARTEAPSHAEVRMERAASPRQGAGA